MRRGTWLYGGSLEAAVSIVRQNYFECPRPEDEPPTPGYPPVDDDGCFYAVKYAIPGAGAGSGSRVFGSLEEAVRHAEMTVHTPLHPNRPFLMGSFQEIRYSNLKSILRLATIERPHEVDEIRFMTARRRLPAKQSRGPIR
jgi:hypothetical protein